MFRSPLSGQVPNCAEAGVIGALPGLVGSIQAIEAVKIIMGVGNVLSSRMILIDDIWSLGNKYKEG